jgi:hypothetical protein
MVMAEHTFPPEFPTRPRWCILMDAARRRIARRKAWGTTDPLSQIAAEIVAGGDAVAFLKCSARGRPSPRSLRERLVAEVRRISAIEPTRRRARKTDAPVTFSAE